jgi:hypothetical protein
VRLVELIAGGSFDRPIDEEEMEAELRRWSHNQFLLLGEVLDMRWLSQEESIAKAPELFEVTWCLDNHNGIIWSLPQGP